MSSTAQTATSATTQGEREEGGREGGRVARAPSRPVRRHRAVLPPGLRGEPRLGWIPALEGVEAKLQSGAHVADVGCGHGASTILMAQAFPRSSFVGFDYHEASVERARAAAPEACARDARPGRHLADRRAVRRRPARRQPRTRSGACSTAPRRSSARPRRATRRSASRSAPRPARRACARSSPRVGSRASAAPPRRRSTSSSRRVRSRAARQSLISSWTKRSRASRKLRVRRTGSASSYSIASRPALAAARRSSPRGTRG